MQGLLAYQGICLAYGIDFLYFFDEKSLNANKTIFSTWQPKRVDTYNKGYKTSNPYT